MDSLHLCFLQCSNFCILKKNNYRKLRITLFITIVLVWFKEQTFFLIGIYCQLAICTSNFQKLKNIPQPLLGFEPPTSDLWGQKYTTRPPRQLSLKGFKVLCSTKHDQSLARWQIALNFGNLEKRLMFILIWSTVLKNSRYVTLLEFFPIQNSTSENSWSLAHKAGATTVPCNLTRTRGEFVKCT